MTHRNRKGEGTVWQRADGRWVARLVYVDDTGTKKRADKYAPTKRQAQDALRAMRRHAEDGAPVVESRATVASWGERWLSTSLPASSRKATTQETYARLSRTHITKGSLADVRLDALTPSRVEVWLIELSATKAESTCRQVHAVLCMMLDGAVREGLIRRNVARSVDKPRVSTREADTYSSREVGRLLAEARGDRLAAFLTLIAYTGMRRGEALAVRWCDVDLDGGVVRVTGTLARVGGALTRLDPKTAKGRRVVPLVPEAVEALREARLQQTRDRLAAGPAWTDSGYLFTTEIGTPVDPRNALRWFYGVRDRVARVLMHADVACSHTEAQASSRKPCERCGRTAADYLGGSLHSFRHAAASVLLANGVPMPIVSDILGHSSIAITVDMYGHMAPTIVADAMTRGLAGYGA